MDLGQYLKKIPEFMNHRDIQLSLDNFGNDTMWASMAFHLGIQKSKYENIIWMDADFQHPPENIKLFHNYQEKFDLIIFSRFLKDNYKTPKIIDEITKEESEYQNCSYFLTTQKILQEQYVKDFGENSDIEDIVDKDYK